MCVASRVPILIQRREDGFERTVARLARCVCSGQHCSSASGTAGCTSPRTYAATILSAWSCVQTATVRAPHRSETDRKVYAAGTVAVLQSRSLRASRWGAIDHCEPEATNCISCLSLLTKHFGEHSNYMHAAAAQV